MKKANTKRLVRQVIGVFVISTLIFFAATAANAEKVYANDRSYCFDFFASKITFTDQETIVDGYFFNFNLDRIVTDISELEMTVYDADGKEICGGAFNELSSTLKEMRLLPGISLYQTFTFTTTRNPNNYNLQHFFTSISCNFSTSGY